MNIQKAYSNWSATYDTDRNRTRDLDQIVTRDTLSSLRCRFILEIGCGTGNNTPLLANIGRSVLALDFSEGMIRRAQEKLRWDHVTFAMADLTHPWPCADRSADLISCNLVLEHIQDLSPIFAEAARVLSEGGRFFICELHPFRQYQGNKAHFQSEQGTTEIQAFVHHLSDFIEAAADHQLSPTNLQEWWHEEDNHLPPRLVSFTFEKSTDHPAAGLHHQQNPGKYR